MSKINITKKHHDQAEMIKIKRSMYLKRSVILYNSAHLVGDDALVDAVVGLAQVLQGQLAVVDAVPLPREVPTVNLKVQLTFKDSGN